MHTISRLILQPNVKSRERWTERLRNSGMGMSSLTCCTAKQRHRWSVRSRVGSRSQVSRYFRLELLNSALLIGPGYLAFACMSQKRALQGSKEARLVMESAGQQPTCQEEVATRDLDESATASRPNSAVAHQKHPQTGEAQVNGVCGKAGWGELTREPHLYGFCSFL